MKVANTDPGRIGREGIVEDLRRREIQAGAGAWSRLLAALADDLEGVRAHRDALGTAWSDRRFADWKERPNLLLAALRDQALGDHDHPLATELLLGGTQPELARRLGLSLDDPALYPVLAARRLSGQEPARAIGWGLVALGFGTAHRGFALVDLGAGAGLGLVGDLVPGRWRVGSQYVDGLDLPSPGVRLGLDRAPIALDDEAELRWLRACIWPGESERRTRLERSVDAWKRPWPPGPSRPRLETHVLGVDDTARVLDAVEGDTGLPVLAYQSVVRAELAPREAEAHIQAMYAWLRAGARRFWVTLEPAPPESTLRPMAAGPLELRVHVADAEGAIDAILVARTERRPKACHPLPGLLAGLRKLWLARVPDAVSVPAGA